MMHSPEGWCGGTGSSTPVHACLMETRRGRGRGEQWHRCPFSVVPRRGHNTPTQQVPWIDRG